MKAVATFKRFGNVLPQMLLNEATMRLLKTSTGHASQYIHSMKYSKFELQQTYFVRLGSIGSDCIQ
jgi:hypothetical protein